MKNIKKMLSLVLSLVMVFAMSATALAATININGGATSSEYAAYKLLNATDGGDGKFAYTLNEKYADILKEVTDKETEAEIVAYISGLDDDGIRAFADNVYAAIKEADPALNPDYTTDSDKFENVDQGYYLIAETKTGNDQDTYSLVMLDTAGNDNITIETKEDVPELTKKVQEKNDSTGTTTGWQDGADYDIGDDVPFQLTGTVSNMYDSYETYYYAFHDKMSPGLTFNEESVVVKVNGTTIAASNYTVVYPVTDGDTFDVVFTDLKKITDVTVTKDSVITVEFTAKLNENAVIGKPGNPNEAKLEYSNNPYGDDKGKTPYDKVVVFTYELKADKVDNKGDALAGAGFILYKWVITEENPAGLWVAVSDEITGVTTFTFSGLDAGQYKLVETTVPAGYNKAADIEFTIEATYDTDSAEPTLTDLVVKDADGNTISEGEEAVFSTNIVEGSVNTDVVNLSGTELPSTGGIGTTIFYVIGSLMMLVAAVLLITKRKMAARNE